jgi:hypothetical protein
MIDRTSRIHAFAGKPTGSFDRLLLQTFPAKEKFIEINNKLKGLIAGGGTLDDASAAKLIKFGRVHLPEQNQVVFNLILQCQVVDHEAHYKQMAAAAVYLGLSLGLKDVRLVEWKNKVTHNGKLCQSTLPFALHMQYQDGNRPDSVLQTNMPGDQLPRSFPAQAKLKEVETRLDHFIAEDGYVWFASDTKPEMKMIEHDNIVQLKHNRVLINLVLRFPVTGLARDLGTHLQFIADAGKRMGEFLDLDDSLPEEIKGKYLEDGKFFEGTFPLVLHLRYHNGKAPRHG